MSRGAPERDKWWRYAPRSMRGAIIVDGRVVDGRQRPWSPEALRAIGRRAALARVKETRRPGDLPFVAVRRRAH